MGEPSGAVQAVQPSPSPISTGVGKTVLPTGEGRVVARFDTMLGPLHFFLSPEHARTFGQQLIDEATAAESGIEIARVIPMAENGRH